jgi:hypothetical protein
MNGNNCNCKTSIISDVNSNEELIQKSCSCGRNRNNSPKHNIGLTILDDKSGDVISDSCGCGGNGCGCSD